jgi:hypothetical protein
VKFSNLLSGHRVFVDCNADEHHDGKIFMQGVAKISWALLAINGKRAELTSHRSSISHNMPSAKAIDFSSRSSYSSMNACLLTIFKKVLPSRAVAKSRAHHVFLNANGQIIKYLRHCSVHTPCSKDSKWKG